MVAEEEAMSSPLRGYGNGPADAYRHIIVTAELTRRFGYSVAYGLATANEWNGTHDPERNAQAAAGRPMDDHNNAIWLDIGRRARSYEDVVRMARAEVARGFAEGGSGREGTPMWLPVAQQSEGPDRRKRFPVLPPDWGETISLHGYHYADERFSARRAFRDGTRTEREAAVRDRLLATPVAEWSQEDMRAAMRLPAYRNSDDPEHRRVAGAGARLVRGAGGGVRRRGRGGCLYAPGAEWTDPGLRPSPRRSLRRLRYHAAAESPISASAAPTALIAPSISAAPTQPMAPMRNVGASVV